MGLAFHVETGKRIPSTTSAFGYGSSAQIIGGPYYGRAYFPSDESSQRVKWVRDKGGLPFEACMRSGPSGETNLITNPRFQAGVSGWSNAAGGALGRVSYGGMWGSGGCGLVGDYDNTVAQLDAYYTYDKGSALGTASYTFSAWARMPISEGLGGLSDISADHVSLRLRIQDGSGHVITNTAYTKLRAADGWVLLTLRASRAWSGNILYVGFEFKTASTPYSPLTAAVDGAGLWNDDHAHAYLDGTFTNGSWSGSADASTSSTSAISGANYALTSVPWSAREGYLSAFCFTGWSPSLNDYSSAKAISLQTVAAFENNAAGFRPAIKVDQYTGGSGGYMIEAEIDSIASVTLNLPGWPHSALHLVLSWTSDYMIIGARGYFNPGSYGLTSNIARTQISAGSRRYVHGVDSSVELQVGGSNLSGTTAPFEGWIRDLCLGNRGLSGGEVDGVLKHGPGPYSGTVAWAPLTEDTDLRLVEAQSFHLGGPLTLARETYAPASGLVASSGTSSTSTQQLTRATTQNVTESFQAVGRLGDLQLTQRAVSELSHIFETAHKLQAQGGRFGAWVTWAMPTIQEGHPTLHTFPAPKRLRSRLVWGDHTLDPRLTGVLGQKGVFFGQVRFERFGYWEGPRTQLLLAKDNASTPAFTFDAQNFNNASGTTDSNYFIVPEGLVEGDLESAAQLFVQCKTASDDLSRVRIARRSRGIPGDVVAVYEAESGVNTYGASASGADVVAASQSGGNVRSLTSLTSGNSFSWIHFEITDYQSAIPDWLYGEYRIVALLKCSSNITDGRYSFRCNVQFYGGGGGVYGEWVSPNFASAINYTAVDLGIFTLPPAPIPPGIGSVSGSSPNGIIVDLQAKQTSGGAATLYCDCIVLLPADECYTQADRNVLPGTQAGADYFMISALDGLETALVLDSGKRVTDTAVLRSRALYVQPRRPNRFWILTEEQNDTYGYLVQPGAQSTVSLYYVPRYLLLPAYEGGGGGGWA